MSFIRLQADRSTLSLTSDRAQIILRTVGGITLAGGGGTSDHTLLSNLAWNSSGHTGGTLQVAGFDGSGNAIDYNASELASLIGLGTAAYDDTTDFAAAVHNHDGVYQPASSALDQIAALDDSDGNFIVGSGAGGWVVESGATARSSLGLGTIATYAGNQDLETSDTVQFANVLATTEVAAQTQMFVGAPAGTRGYITPPDSGVSTNKLPTGTGQYFALTSNSDGSVGSGAETNNLETTCTGILQWELVIGASGGGSADYLAISALTDIGTPDSGDWLLIQDITDGSLKKVDIGSLPTGSGMASFNVTGDAGTGLTLSDGETLNIVGGTGMLTTTTPGTPEQITVALDSATAWTIKANATSGVAAPTDVAVGGLTEETTPAAGDFLVGWESGGALRKFDVGDLPFEASGAIATHAAVTSSVHGIADTSVLVTGPASSVDSNFAAFNGTGGKTLKDSGYGASSFEASGAVSTHAALTSGVHGISAFGATLVDDASASAAATTLQLGTTNNVHFNTVHATGGALETGLNGVGAMGQLTIWQGTGAVINGSILPANLTAARLYQLPDAAGTFALTSNTDGSVAGTAISSGAATSSQALFATGAGGASWRAPVQADVTGLKTTDGPTFASLVLSSASGPDISIQDTDFPNGGLYIGADNTDGRGYIYWMKSSTEYSLVKCDNLTAARTHQLPNAAGTFALTSNTDGSISNFSTSTTTSGLAPGSNGVGATYYLDATGTWSIPGGSESNNLETVCTGILANEIVFGATTNQASYSAISALTDIGTPDSGDWLLIQDITDGSLKKVDIGSLPTGTGMSSFDVQGDSGTTSISDGETLDIGGGTGIVTTVTGGTPEQVTIALAAAAAWTLKGNATSGSAAPTDFDISGLTDIGTPESGDWLLIEDATDGSFKKVDIGSLPSGSGNVSNTGTPVDNQIAVWTNATTIEGTTGLTYDGSNFNASGTVQVNSNAKLSSSAVGRFGFTSDAGISFGQLDVNNGLQINPAGYFGWFGAAGGGGTVQLGLYKDADGILGIRSPAGSGPYAVRIYSDLDNPAGDYERLSLSMDGSGNATIATEAGGAGSDGNINLTPGSGSSYSVGNFYPSSGGVYSLGDATNYWSTLGVGTLYVATVTERVTDAGVTIEGVLLKDSNVTIGTPPSGTLTNCTGLPVSTGISGLGTGVATALAVNTGTAGAFVVNGGVLGTPSSGTLTSCTGLPIVGGTTGTLTVGRGGTGATTLTGLVKGNGTGAFTAVTAPTGTVVGTTDTQTLSNKDLTAETNKIYFTKSVAIESPASGDRVPIFMNERAVVIKGVSHASAGGTSVVYNVEYGTTIASGTVIHTDTCATTTPEWDVTPSGTTSIATNQIICLEIGTVTGTVDVMHVTIEGYYN